MPQPRSGKPQLTVLTAKKAKSKSPRLGSQRAANAAGEPKTALTTKRTFKISNDLWDDFVALAAAKKLTQAELVNELMTNAIAADRELIERYRKFFGEYKEK